MTQTSHSGPASPAVSGEARGHVHAASCGDHHHHAGIAAGGVSADTLLAGRDLTLARGGRTILESVDIDIRPGEIVTLIGPNGAGKTSLVRVLLGLVRPDRGRVLLSPGKVVGYVPQRFERDAAIPMTVARFLTLGAPAMPTRIASILDEVGAGHIADRQLARLSGGELQRAVLARALVREPDLLVLDEPASGVDHLGEADLYGLIARLRDERGLSVLLVSHDLHVVMARSDRVLCLNRHVCCHGVPETVAQHPEYVRLFGAAARAFGIYQHHHDHAHGLSGEPLTGASEPGEDTHA